MTESADPDRPSRVVTKRVRRGLGGWWILALILVPLLIATLATWTRHGAIEDDLTQRTTLVLQDHGFADATVRFAGRDAEVSVSPGADADRVTDLVEGVTGVRAVTVLDAGA